MSDPLVVAVMLTKDRPEMAARAVRCFRAQTYAPKRLMVVNTGSGPVIKETSTMREPCFIGADALSIGALRNLGCREAWNTFGADIFVHADDDDWSHPNRIAEQVSLLQSSGKQCVGYRELLFWKQAYEMRNRVSWQEYNAPVVELNDSMAQSCTGEAYLYSNANPRYALGTSLCYWRSAWEAHPFDPELPKPDRNGQMISEDTAFIRSLDAGVLGVSSMSSALYYKEIRDVVAIEAGEPAIEPRMIATIHGGNASKEYSAENLRVHYKRVPQWDDHCRKETKK